MAMTITNANDVNTLLQHVLNLPGVSGSVPDMQVARSAAMRLAAVAYATLNAGLSSSDVDRTWPTDEPRPFISIGLAADVSSYAGRPHVEEAEKRLRASDWQRQEHRPGEFEDAMRAAMHEAAAAQVHATLAVAGEFRRVTEILLDLVLTDAQRHVLHQREAARAAEKA